jgi:hypothetical protein
MRATKDKQVVYGNVPANKLYPVADRDGQLQSQVCMAAFVCANSNHHRYSMVRAEEDEAARKPRATRKSGPAPRKRTSCQ